MEYVNGALACLAYAAVGITVMMLGVGLVDVLTPGRLGDLIWKQRNANAALVLSSGLIGIALIVVVAILTSNDGLAAGLLSTGVYGVIGVVLMGVSFVLVDAITPGRLGDVLTESAMHPAAWVTASVHLAVGGIIAAAIS